MLPQRLAMTRHRPASSGRFTIGMSRFASIVAARSALGERRAADVAIYSHKPSQANAQPHPQLAWLGFQQLRLVHVQQLHQEPFAHVHPGSSTSFAMTV